MKAIDGLSSQTIVWLFYKHNTIDYRLLWDNTQSDYKDYELNAVTWTYCIVKVFLLSEREIRPNYTGIFLDFAHGFGSYVKGQPKMKPCDSVAVTVSVRCICETALSRSVKRNSQCENGQPMEQTRSLFCMCDSGVARCQSQHQCHIWQMNLMFVTNCMGKWARRLSIEFVLFMRLWTVSKI